MYEIRRTEVIATENGVPPIEQVSYVAAITGEGGAEVHLRTSRHEGVISVRTEQANRERAVFVKEDDLAAGWIALKRVEGDPSIPGGQGITAKDMEDYARVLELALEGVSDPLATRVRTMFLNLTQLANQATIAPAGDPE